MEQLILEPEFYVDFDGIVKNGPIVIRDGCITEIGEITERVGKIIRLENQAILPGFVNCHSHAFQRALRGLVEQKNEGPDNFFSWRKKMYQLTQSINPNDFALLARLVFLEMLEAGFTHVGEFHYLHNDIGGKPYSDPLTMSRVLFEAACDVGINLCLLMCAYQRSDFNEPLTYPQKRFAHTQVDDFLALVKQAQRDLKGAHITIGCAIHSPRAVPESWFLPINDFVIKNRMPLHLHVSEQEQDVANSIKHTGHSPIGLANINYLLAPHTTLIHATHLINDDLEALKTGRPNICICPSTEKNLGDGVIKLLDLDGLNLNICLGTDQHVRLDPFSEARSLEEQERLRLKKRNVLGKPKAFLHQTLLPCLNKSGMHSLYPTFTPSLLGQPANLIAVNLPPEYLWHGPLAALDAMMLSHTPAQITHVITNGHLVIQDKQLLYREKQDLINELRSFFKKITLSN